jgi:hypothetical protein
VTHVFSNLEEDDGDVPALCDMTFEIVDPRFDEARDCWCLKCEADADPYEPVGVVIEIPMSGWREQVSDVGEGDDAFRCYWGEVTLRSSGPPSDRLLALMADYYGVEHEGPKWNVVQRLLGKSAASTRFVTEVRCLAVGIASDPRSLEDASVHLKLFFDDSHENGRYAEIFVEVNLPAGFLMLNEKDEEYRTDLIHWLSLAGPVNANPHPGQPGVVLH